jgi:hypothetical protein
MIRIAKKSDIRRIEELIALAKASLKKDGVDQWQKSNPDRRLVEGQIEKEAGYVYERDGEVYAYAFLSENVEPTYKRFEDDFEGSNYLVIHTYMVDSASKIKGIGTKFMQELVSFAQDYGKDSLRIDTHEDNFRMRGLLDKFSFRELGIIQVDEDGIAKDRLCYEKIL